MHYTKNMTNAEIDKIIDRAIKKSAKESDARMQQYIGAISEQSAHNIKAIGEQHTGVVRQIAELNRKADEAKEDRDHIKMELYGIKNVSDATFEEVGALRMEMTEHNEKMNNHEERITVLETRVR